MAKRNKAAHRRLAAWILADLVRLAAVQRAGGKSLNVGAWLAVGANILSSAPPGRESGACGAPERFGLTYEHLFIFAERCRLNSSADDIQRQVAVTLEWRAAESARIGRPHHVPMSPDTIGKLLGVTEGERSAAGARNIGTACGSREAREAAARERNKARQRIRRREAGKMTREEYLRRSLSKSKPWEAEGISRAQWYRRRGADETSPCETSPCVTNKGDETSPSGTNIDDRQNASARSALEAPASISETRGDIGARDSLPSPAADAEELAERLRRKRSEPAPPRPPLPPGGLAARALALVQKPPPRPFGAGALGRARPGVGKIAAE
jgi:hypothetical protein